jgi:rhodanese-related sulfurtransferase
MKYLGIISIFILILFSGCSNSNTNESITDTVKVAENQAKIELTGDSKLLLDYLNDAGDYVNSKEFPSLIKASIVYEELGKNNLVVDIREPNEYKKGHIKGAVNVNFKDIPEYFQAKIKPFEYDKIIIVCNTGQNSSYTASLLRLMGYGNAYAMRWGMSAWNKDVAKDYWLKGISSKHEDQLETSDISKPVAGKFPDLTLSLKTGEEVLQARIKKIFDEGLASTIILADSVFSRPSDYFIVNYDRKDKYDAGHIPGAIRYKPNGTLGIVDEMATLPDNKKIVVYCGTGHNTGFVTAYLRLFGYNAQTLNYGNIGFMSDKMLKEKTSLSWVTFSNADVANYPLVK